MHDVGKFRDLDTCAAKMNEFVDEIIHARKTGETKCDPKVLSLSPSLSLSLTSSPPHLRALARVSRQKRFSRQK